MAGNTNQAGTDLFAPTTSVLDACLTDSDGYIYFGRVTGTPPTTASIFKHGCLLNQTDSATGSLAVWQNVGSTAVPSWGLVQTLGSQQTSAVPSETYVKSTTLTTTNVLALNTTLQTVVPAPGAGKVVIVKNASFSNVFSGIAYVASSMELRYGNSSGVKVLTDVASGFLSSPSIATWVENGLTTNLVAGVNSPVILWATTAPTAGDSPILITVEYRVASTS